MNKYISLKNSFAFLTIFALIVNVSVSGISNSSLASILIKIASSALMILIFCIHLRQSEVSLFTLFSSASLKKLIIILTSIFSYLAVTLIYSTNPNYGLLKILNILISILPNIFVLYYLINSMDKNRYKEYFIFIIASGFFLTLAAVLVFQPFDQSTIYQFTTRRWSHVFVGRIISFLTLIIFFYSLYQKESKRIFIYSVVFIVGLYITYLTGLRSALLGLSIFTIAAFIWSLYKKNLSKYHYYSMILIVAAMTVLIFITPQSFSTSLRISNLVKIEDLSFGGDAPILTRVESYKISWQMFTERPLIGYGFGSFNGYNGIQWLTIQKYPHNIILEILSELGLAGFVLFCFLAVYLIKKIIHLPRWDPPLTINHQPPVPMGSTIPFLLIAFLFSLFLAMFSKDISTQSFLWIFLTVYGAENKV